MKDKIVAAGFVVLVFAIARGEVPQLVAQPPPSSTQSTSSQQPAEAWARLGEKLFHDARLSADGSIACSTCHDAARAFTDGRPVAQGIKGAPGTRNAPSLLGVATAKSLFWDGRRATLEQQVAEPFINPHEHGLRDHGELIAKVAAARDYEPYLDAIHESPKTLSAAHVFGALAAFLRTLTPTESAFDRFYFGGDKAALTPAAQHGLALFRGSAGCSQCHLIEADRALLTDHKFHSLGIGLSTVTKDLPRLVQQVMSASPTELERLITSDAKIAALGRFVVTKDPADIGKYKTPSLRNVAMTAPYMHDGSVATLREAVDHEIYYRSIELSRAFVLTPAEREDLVAFLETLTSACLRGGNCPGM